MSRRKKLLDPPIHPLIGIAVCVLWLGSALWVIGRVVIS